MTIEILRTRKLIRCEKLFFFAGLLVASSSTILAQKGPVGLWLTKKKDAKVEIVQQRNKRIEGKIVWVKSLIDKDQKHIGVVILRNFILNKNGKEYDGKILHTGQNKFYSGIVYNKNEKTLSVKGYIRAPILGTMETWTRVK